MKPSPRSPARPPAVGPGAAFRRPRLLLVGCGDVGRRVLRLLPPGLRCRVLSRDPQRDAGLRAPGTSLLAGDLDRPETLRRLAGLAGRVLHLAPPPAQGDDDARTRALQRALARGRAVQHLVYGSTTGVYGDAGGAWVDESRPVAPATGRAQRRVAAERKLRAWGRRGPRVTVLRIPGIYAADREGGHPAQRLQRGLPVLRPEDDIYTNHIHAEDLARACILALWRGRPQRTLNVVDATDMKMGACMDALADRLGRPRPERVSRSEAGQVFSPMQMSFLGESRRLRAERLRRELRLALRYPTVFDALPVPA